MAWSDFYLFCFLVGFTLSVLSFFSAAFHFHLPFKWHLPFHGGHHPGGMAGRGTMHTRGGLSWFNGMTIMTFLAWFGGIGYLLSTHSRMVAVVALGIAILWGLISAGMVFKFMRGCGSGARTFRGVQFCFTAEPREVFGGVVRHSLSALSGLNKLRGQDRFS